MNFWGIDFFTIFNHMIGLPASQRSGGLRGTGIPGEWAWPGPRWGREGERRGGPTGWTWVRAVCTLVLTCGRAADCESRWCVLEQPQTRVPAASVPGQSHFVCMALSLPALVLFISAWLVEDTSGLFLLCLYDGEAGGRDPL